MHEAESQYLEICQSFRFILKAIKDRDDNFIEAYKRKTVLDLVLNPGEHQHFRGGMVSK